MPANADMAQDERASDRIIRTLEADIVSGRLPDRSPLPPERDLMERFGASRTVIREAITALSNRGLIDTRPRFRPIVRKPDFETVLNASGETIRLLIRDPLGVKNLYDIRVFMERALVREAALHARKEDITRLRDALRDNHAAIPDSREFYVTDVAFHRVLYDVPRNPIYPVIHRAFFDWLSPYWDKMLRSPERNRVNYSAHETIVSAICDRDPDAAEEAMIGHLRAAWEYVRPTFEDTEEDQGR